MQPGARRVVVMATWRERLAHWIMGADALPSAPVPADPGPAATTAHGDELDALRERQDAVARTLAILEAEARVVRAAQARREGRR